MVELRSYYCLDGWKGWCKIADQSNLRTCLDFDKLSRVVISILLLAAIGAVRAGTVSQEVIDGEFALLQNQIRQAQSTDPGTSRRQELLKSQTLRREALIFPSDSDPVDVVFRRVWALLEDLAHFSNAMDLSIAQSKLSMLGKLSANVDVKDVHKRKELFRRLCRLRREVAFSNPLLDFDKVIFLTHHRAYYGHMCDQYYGFHARPGGGIYILANPFGDNPQVRDVLADSVVQNGRLAGKRLEGGSFISLELSYDGNEILFAWTQAARTVNQWTPASTYHIFRADVNGTNLRQLTDGAWNEFDPCYLPGGRIAFISERRGGYLRCSGKGGRPNPTYALFCMNTDGSNIFPLSYHETHEWHPSVDNNGMLVYTRWDYVDRDSDIAHHIWISYPDGRNPRSFHGNYPIVREHRPWMEMSIRAVPNSHKYVAAAAPHHGQAYGSLVLIDSRLDDDRAMSQAKRITPEVPFPESEGKRGEHEVYGSPWPLSEDYYLCVYDAGVKHYGIYLVDSFGNRELIYRDPEVPCLDPVPLLARRKPHIIPDEIECRMPLHADVPEMGAIGLVNVYDSDFDWPGGTVVKSLRVIQLFPKATPREYEPNIGAGRQSLARGVLGTVPVEADGSAYFKAPVGVPLYFQALDENGRAVQSMRSDTYLHPGEKLICQGCHEPKRKMLHNNVSSGPTAFRRKPTRPKPDVDGSFPLSFPRLVQPVLDKKCSSCHQQHDNSPNLSGQTSGEYGWSKSFQSLMKYAWAKHGGNGSIKINKTSHSVAGNVGAQASKLYQILTSDSHRERVKLTDEELYRFVLWLDCNSNFYGAYHDLESQAGGDIVVPSLW